MGRDGDRCKEGDLFIRGERIQNYCFTANTRVCKGDYPYAMISVQRGRELFTIGPIKMTRILEESLVPNSTISFIQNQKQYMYGK